MLGLTCDCLNYCGDDPYLRTGKSKPCTAQRDRMHRDAIKEKQQAFADVQCQKFGVFNLLDLVEAQATHIQRLEGAP